MVCNKHALLLDIHVIIAGSKNMNCVMSLAKELTTQAFVEKCLVFC